jgi:hypothetical protein
MTDSFDFMTSYRKLVPQASREIVDARQKAHSQLRPKITTMQHIYDLCRLAFQLDPHSPGLTAWFEVPVKAADPQFSLEIDKAEAGRIASLLLRDHIISGAGAYTALVVLTASYCGQRTTVDDNALLVLAKDKVTSVAKLQRKLSSAAIKAPLLAMPAVATKAIEPNPPTTEGLSIAFEAVMKSAEEALATLAELANDAVTASRADTERLAEEVDMLWWYLGDWCDLLGKARTSIDSTNSALVSGIELGSLVQRIPGPHGAYGLLLRSAGEAAEKKTTLGAAVTSFGNADARKLGSPTSLPAWAKPIFPVHAALQSATEGTNDRQDVSEIEMGAYEIGLQAYRERMLINYGGFEQ